MSQYAAAAALVLAVFTSTGSAQQAPSPAQPPAAAGKPAPAEKPAPAQNRPEPPPPLGQPVNVKLDITITDQAAGEPAKKTVSLLVADRAVGSIRSIANSVRAQLNVDANPQILPSGLIKVQLGLEYNPQRGDGPPTGSSLNQRVSIVLTPGRPLLLSQAADPLSDRKITVEVRADILK